MSAAVGTHCGRGPCAACACPTARPPPPIHPDGPQVEMAIPSKDTPLLVGCSDGQAYSIEALTMLEDAGYTRLVGLRG